MGLRFRRLLVVGALAVSALTHPVAAQEAPPPVPPASIPDLRPVNLNRFVPTAEERTVAFYSSLFPDCSSKGPIVGRLTTKPEHGTLNFVPTDSFPFYGSASTLAACAASGSPVRMGGFPEGEARAQAADAIGVLRLGRKHDDRQIRVPRLVDAVATAHAAAQIDATHPGQHHIQQHQVGLRLSEQLDRLFGGAGGQHRVVICAEVLHQKLHDSGLVLDDEHG
jgi:hypothetical protein